MYGVLQSRVNANLDVSVVTARAATTAAIWEGSTKAPPVVRLPSSFARWRIVDVCYIGQVDAGKSAVLPFWE